MAGKVKVVLSDDGLLMRECKANEPGVFIHENHLEDLKAGGCRYVGGKIQLDSSVPKSSKK